MKGINNVTLHKGAADEIGSDNMVLCRRISEVTLECECCHKPFRPANDYHYRGGICRKCWMEVHNP